MSEQTKNGATNNNTTPPAESEIVGQEKSAEKESVESELRQELARLEKELESRSKRVDEVTRAYSALLNDQKDFRARLEREKERVLENERGKIALHMLQVSDEIERALSAVQPDEKNSLLQGVRLIYDGLMRTLGSMGIERLSLEGKAFDPNQAEAVDLVMVDDPALDSKVMAEALAGYKIGERVLRPARVRVARHVPVTPTQEQNQNPDVVAERASTNSN